MEEVEIEVSAPGDGQPDAIALPLPEDDSTPRSNDDRLGARLQQLADDGELKGELGRTVVLHSDGTSDARRVVVAGVGKRADIDADAIRTAASAVARRLGDVGGTLAWTLDDSLPLSADEQARAVVEGAVLGAYSPARWKTEQKTAKRIGKIVFYAGEADGIADTASRAARVGKWVNWARDLANSPPNELTPADLATRTAWLAGSGLQVSALDPAEIDELGMGALSAVGRASANGPRLIVLRYEPAQAKGSEVLGLVGMAMT